jgi:hypothetical protein
MKYAWMVAVLVCVVLTSCAFAQDINFTPRSLAMGTASVAVANDAGAWFQNPAGLASLNVAVPAGKQWANDVIGAYADSGDSAWGFDWAGSLPSQGIGVGAGYADLSDSKDYGVGFGMKFKTLPLSWGVNVVRNDPDAFDTTTYFNAGLMYKFVGPKAGPITAGLMVNDISNEFGGGTTFTLGLAAPVIDKLSLAVDAIDITSKIHSMINFGAEYKLGEKSEWTVRAGDWDGDLTLGAGYALPNNWRLDAAWADTTGDATWTVAAGFAF